MAPKQCQSDGPYITVEECFLQFMLSDSEKAEYDMDFEKRTIRYVDWRIIPVLAMVNAVAAIDGANLGSAYTAGMGVDLGLNEGNRFNLIIGLFFIPNVLLQIPGNLVVRKVGVRNWLTFIVVAWGVVQLGMGFVSTWYWLLVCRFLLGAFEASLYPSVIFILTTWYKRHEVQTRLALHLVLSVVGVALSPIFGYIFNLLGGRGNLAGWRWIFIIEGLLTLVAGVITWFFIPDFPDQNTFLTATQTALVLKRIDDDRGDATPDELTAQKVRKHLLDWRLWAYGILSLCSIAPSSSIVYFLPIILNQMGWSKTKSLLLSAAPHALVVVALLVGYFADRYKHRAAFITLGVFICITGIALLSFAEASSVRYFGAFLIAAGSGTGVPSVMAYAANNVVSHSKRSVQTAILSSFRGIGSIVGTVSYRAQDAPRYIPGLMTTLATQGLLLAVLLFTTIYFMWQNRLVRSGARLKPLEGQLGFYYTL